MNNRDNKKRLNNLLGSENMSTREFILISQNIKVSKKFRFINYYRAWADEYLKED